MKHKEDILEYISLYCTDFMNDLEKAASNHHTAQVKFLRYKDRSINAREAYDKLSSNDPKVLNLLKDGYKSFIRKASLRIYNENFNELKLNTCPNCGEIARTPTAKQCRYCKFDWH